MSAKNWLNEAEREILKEWKSKELPAIPLNIALGMFELFINGYQVEEIARLNPGYEVGAILNSRYTDRWDDRKIDLTNAAYSSIQDKVQRTQVNSASFLSDCLETAHRLHGDKLKKFIQTGDPKDLGSFEINDIDSYRKISETLQKLVGKETKESEPKRRRRAQGTELLELQELKELQDATLSLPENADTATILAIFEDADNKDKK